MKRLLLCFIVITWAASQSFAQTIDSLSLKSHVGYLASDLLMGRKPGSKGDEMSANYIVDHFINNGLKPMYENGFQYFDVVAKVYLGDNNSFVFGDSVAQLEKEYLPLSFSENSNLKASTAFCGYGFNISSNGIKWNDFEGIDVKGKWVIILRGDPQLDSASSVYIDYSDDRSKVLSAKDMGASGVLLVNPSGLSDNDNLMKLLYDKSSSGSGIPVINISRNLAGKILSAESKPGIDSLVSILNGTLEPYSFNLKTEISASVDVRKSFLKTQNVVAVLEGSDPVLKNDYLVVGGHYDHLGMGGDGSGSRNPDTTAVHNGADDNASGVAAVLELSKLLGKENLKRSIVFVAFGAEEMGLLGSKTYTDKPGVNLKSIKAMFNFDMVGRLNRKTNTMSVGGTGSSVEAKEILNSFLDTLKLSLVTNDEGFGPSDHAAFYANNIPVFFVSSGAHEDYHTPEDDVDKLNFTGLTHITEYFAEVIKHVANMDTSLTFKEAGPRVRSQKSKYKVTLGIVPDFASQDVSGLGVDGVRKGGPAETGGIRKGDVITALNGKALANIYEYMARLKSLEPGQLITVDILRNGEKLVLLVQL